MGKYDHSFVVKHVNKHVISFVYLSADNAEAARRKVERDHPGTDVVYVREQ